MKSRASVLILAMALLWALPAFTQGNPNGKLSGRVTSGSEPLPGVKVTVTSPNLQGSRSTVTSTSGDYLFPSLPPGEYSVTFEAQGLRTVKQELRIGAAQSNTLDAEMTAEAVTEEIVVTGSLENISQTVQSATTYTKQLIDELPTGRTVTEVVALSPGVQPNGPAKNTTTGLGSITISGAPSYENLFLVNGVVNNENVRGQTLDLYIEDAVQETTTASAGVSAEYGRFTGGVVNVLTKSGGNTFSGSLRDTLRNQSWEAKTPGTTQQTDKVNPTYEATLGGPILRDRLWFFLAGRDLDLSQTLNTNFTNIPYPSGEKQQRYEGKLTASLTSRHTLVGSYMKVKDKQLGNSFQAILDLASVYDRETPQEQYSGNYTGVLTENLVATAQYSKRKFTFLNSGAPSTDLIAGTLLLDRSRGNARYHSPTFCGVCGPELRNNENYLGKLSYFLSTERTGSHEIVGGVDSFNDIRLANNHQSGSDYRILGTSAIIRGSDIFPVFANTGSTIIQYNPIAKLSQGTAFKTNSAYLNDNWRFNDRLTFGIGVRYDSNDGRDEEGKKVAKDSNISPRLSVTYDVHGDARYIAHASYGRYVAAIANAIGDSTSAAGAPQTYQWTYRGPAINTDPNGQLLTQDQAIRALFDWFQSQGGPNGLTPFFVSIPGGNTLIRGSLDSPSVVEYALGLTTRLGDHGLLRVDLIHRDWQDFYAARTDLSTGHVVAGNGPTDLTLIENNDSLYERRYDALQTQFRYSPSSRLDLGGNWTLSHTQGNFDGESRANGPVTGTSGQYPEYKDPAWNNPKGDLSTDQRHRVTLYGLYNVFTGGRQGLTVSLAQSFFSGHPYDAPGSATLIKDPKTGERYLTVPGYLNQPVRVTYYFSKRGAFTTSSVLRTDLAVNYSFKFADIDFFVQPQIINLFNRQAVDTTDNSLFDTTVLTADNGGICRDAPGPKPIGQNTCVPFNPYTEKPVEGVNWQKGPKFGKASNPLAYQTPRTFRVSFGLRF